MEIRKYLGEKFHQDLKMGESEILHHSIRSTEKLSYVVSTKHDSITKRKKDGSSVGQQRPKTIRGGGSCEDGEAGD